MKRALQIAVGLLIGAALCYFLFRSVDVASLMAALRTVNPWWLLLSQVPLAISFYTRILRWRYVVRATAPASFRSMFSATQIGFLANFTLPARAGEFIRPLVLSRLASIPFSKALALSSLDRVTDLFGLIAVMLVAGAAFQPTEAVPVPPELLGRPYTFTPEQLRTAALAPLILSFGVIVAFVLLYLNTPLALRISTAVLGRISARLTDFVNGMMTSFAEGLHVFRSPGDMAKSIAWSLVTWALFTTGTVCILQAFAIDYPWYTPFVIQTTLSVCIALPGAPGFIGQFQAGILIGLALAVPGVDYALALAVGLVAHIANVVPIAVTGVYCLVREQMGLLELRQASQEAEGALEEELVHPVEEK